MGSEFKVPGHLGPLDPGATSRRWEPPGGTKKHNEKIHKESKFADDHKDLPFKFSKPKKAGRCSLFECTECGYIISASVNNVGFVCPECKKFTKSREVVELE